MIPSQFWLAMSFDRASVVLNEKLRVSVPASRAVRLASPTVQPQVTEQDGQRIYQWQTNNLKVEEAKSSGAKKAQPADIAVGLS